MKLLAAIGAAIGIFSAGSLAWAEPADPACVAREKAAAQQEEADRARVGVAVAAFNQGSFAALGTKLPDLEAVLAHAPARYEEHDCAGARVFRPATSSPAEVLALLTAGAARGERTEVWRPSPYTTASLLLGSYQVEMQHYEAALPYLRRGLAISPGDARLATETANTLSHLGRVQEGLPIIDRVLGSGALLEATDHARLLRAKGFALGELKHYDEAEVAYKESLKLQPGHVGAQNELIYLARQKAGQAPTPSLMVTSDKSATTSADDVIRERVRQGRPTGLSSPPP